MKREISKGTQKFIWHLVAFGAVFVLALVIICRVLPEPNRTSTVDQSSQITTSQTEENLSTDFDSVKERVDQANNTTGKEVKSLYSGDGKSTMQKQFEIRLFFNTLKSILICVLLVVVVVVLIKKGFSLKKVKKFFDEGDEIRIGLVHNKNIYSYYTVVGTEIPKKLWLTRLKLSNKITIEGQADNLESVYAFFRSIKDYNPESKVKLQKLSLATSTPMSAIDTEEVMTNLEDNTDDILTSLNADFYEFIISDDPAAGQKNNNNNSKQTKGKKASKKKNALPALEPIND